MESKLHWVVEYISTGDGSDRKRRTRRWVLAAPKNHRNLWRGVIKMRNCWSSEGCRAAHKAHMSGRRLDDDRHLPDDLQLLAQFEQAPSGSVRKQASHFIDDDGNLFYGRLAVWRRKDEESDLILCRGKLSIMRVRMKRKGTKGNRNDGDWAGSALSNKQTGSNRIKKNRWRTNSTDSEDRIEEFM